MPLIQIFSSLFMISDLDMYDEAQDECCQVNSPSLTEELGQVTHIFSDKTGTLTSNHMEFMRCFIDGVTYGCGDTAISQVLNKQPGRPPPALRTAPRPAWATVRPCSATFVNFQEALSSPSLFDAAAQARTRSSSSRWRSTTR
jgi:magnesium-transporting ATPase (P-type)